MLFARKNLAELTEALASPWWMFGAVTMIVALGYTATLLERGWIPHDEGQLGHTAERVLNGELPHRDYVEPYTGGLSYLHAIAFRFFGTGSRALRLTMLPFFAAFVACTYWIAARAGPPWLAATVTLLCVCLTVPVYPASMPSWYNLFAAVCGSAALLRYLDTGRARWVLLAGLLAGFSILIKITGLYFVAAGLLFLAVREQYLCHTDPGGDQSSESDARAGRSICFSIIASILLLIFGSLGIFYLRGENRWMDLAHFALPLAGLALLAIQNEWRLGRGTLVTRVYRLTASVGPFLFGVALPLMILLTVYWHQDALLDLYHGVIVLPGRRLAGARMGFPSLSSLLMAAPWTGLLMVGFVSQRPRGTLFQALVMFLLLVLWGFSHTDQGHLAIFQGLRNQLPLLVVVTMTLLASRFGRRLPNAQQQELVLLTAVAFLVSLVQFPYSGGFYFFYAAAPTVLLALFVIRSQPFAPRFAHLACLVFVVVFLIFRVHQPGPAIAGGPYRPHTATNSMQLARCNLTVRSDQAALYQQLVAAIAAHSSDDAYIYATPDCPEVYFLSGRRNPTKTTYELFDDHQSKDALLETLDAFSVKVVVLKRYSEFSRRVDAELIDELRDRFPGREACLGPDGATRFLVLWRS